MYMNDGYNSAVITYNSQVFTFGYLYDRVNYNTKIKETHFVVITKKNIGDVIVKTEDIWKWMIDKKRF